MCASQCDAVCAPGQLRNDTSPPRDRRTDASAASASWNGSFVPASIQTGTRSKRPWIAAVAPPFERPRMRGTYSALCDRREKRVTERRLRADLLGEGDEATAHVVPTVKQDEQWPRPAAGGDDSDFNEASPEELAPERV